MGILSWIVMGLIVGALAKIFISGTGPGGILSTIILGIIGALVGGFIGQLLGIGAVTEFSLRSFLLALCGAILVLLLFRAIRKK